MERFFRCLAIFFLTVIFNIAYATGGGTGGTGGATGPSADVKALIAYFNSVLQNKYQADSQLIFMPSPGTTAAIQNEGSSVTNLEPQAQNFSENMELQGMNWGIYGTAPGQPVGTGSQYAINFFLQNHLQKYCSPSSVLEPALGGSGKCGNKDPQYEQGDLRISSLLDPVVYKDNNQVGAAMDVIRNLTTPFPTDNNLKIQQLFAPNSNMSVADKQKVLNVYIEQALLNVARNTYDNMLAMRTSANYIASQGKSGGGGALPPGAGSGDSVMSIMARESSRRFLNNTSDVDWYKLVDQASSEALLRELVQMEAYRMWMDFHQYRQQENIAALLGSLLTTITRATDNLSQSISTAATQGAGG